MSCISITANEQNELVVNSCKKKTVHCVGNNKSGTTFFSNFFSFVFVDFDLWKEEEEKTNVCLFIKEAGKHTLINGDQRLIYQCHRSGHYSGHGFGKRSFRVKGTCKLGKRCTAGIELTVKEKADVHEVVYYKTHIWHEPDVIHVNLSTSERTYLANKLKEGASIASILESVKADKSVEGTSFCKRIHLLKRKDLVNIENTFRLNNTERHLRKQHKRGQQIDLENIRKNIDDRGEVVSWILESSDNKHEYFTVKKLQPRKCDENCGVMCAPCDVCLHMYSCTCHDYLLFGTMCQHIHAVSLSLCPVPTQFSSKQSLKHSSSVTTVSTAAAIAAIAPFNTNADINSISSISTAVAVVNNDSNNNNRNNNDNIFAKCRTAVTMMNTGNPCSNVVISTNSVTGDSITSNAIGATNISDFSFNSPVKKRLKHKAEVVAKQTTDIIAMGVSDCKENDIVNFLTKNLNNQREQELQFEKNKLKEKIEFFKSLCESRIDLINEKSLQMVSYSINLLVLYYLVHKFRSIISVFRCNTLQNKLLLRIQ